MLLMGNTFFFPWEVSLMEWLQTYLGPGFISIMSFFSYLGDEKILLVIVGFIYWGLDKKLGKSVGFCIIMATIWCSMIKNIVIRRRPYFDHEGIDIYKVVDSSADKYDIVAQGYSFPSIHSCNSLSLFGSLARLTKKKWLITAAVILPFLVGFSRVVVGAHYPTDVLAGWGIGLFAILVIPELEKRIENPFIFYGLLILTGLPGLFFCHSNDYYTAFGLLIGFIAGLIVEDRYVGFENTDKALRIVLRTVGGIVIYLVLNEVLKIPFSKSFLEGGSHAALLVRCARNAITAFVIFGIYPMVFRKETKEN